MTAPASTRTAETPSREAMLEARIAQLETINAALIDRVERASDVQGGAFSLFETAIEVRRDIGESFQAVAFVDAGSVGFQETPNFSNMRYGAGLGVRYKLPFGPIRADIAFPLDAREDDAAFQLYISIGQAF